MTSNTSRKQRPKRKRNWNNTEIKTENRIKPAALVVFNADAALCARWRDNRRSTSRAKITGSPMTDTATWHTRPKAAKDSAKLRPTGRMKMRALRKSTPIQQSGLPHTHTLTGYNTSWTETTATSWKARAKRAARESGRGRDRELKARGETGIFCGICIQLTIATIVIVIAIPMACQLQLTLRLNGPPNGFCPLPTGTSHQIPWNSESPLECLFNCLVSVLILQTQSVKEGFKW